ncbi:MAG: ATP-binding protein [Nitrospirota bacterium]
MKKQLRTLIIEDSEDDSLLLVRELQRGGYELFFQRVQTREEMQAALKEHAWDIVISDYIMPQFTGIDALEILQESGLDLPFIIVSGNIGEDTAVQAMKAGAHDYLLKGNLTRLLPAVERELRDVEVRRARKSAEEERSLLIAAIESSADGIVVTNSQGTILYVNAGFEQITGFSKADVLGKTLHLLDSGKYDQDFFESMRETIRRDNVWRGQLFNKKKDGTLYLEDCTYSPVKDSSGNIVHYISVKRDVTEKVRLESIAESVNMMNNIGYIFSGVRHEIGNPINSINMTLCILKQKLEMLDTTAIHGYLDRALHEVSRIEYLLRTLKNFNLYEKPHLQDVPLQVFLDKFLVLVREDFKAKGITIESAIDPQAHSCYADPRALQQILINLLTNAADALADRSNPKVSILMMRLGNRMQIRMEDNGVGISDEKTNDLFKPFYTSKTHGTGLGLVIVKKLLAKMNGTIELSSHYGVGTTVDIYLPVADTRNLNSQNRYPIGRTADETKMDEGADEGATEIIPEHETR